MNDEYRLQSRTTTTSLVVPHCTKVERRPDIRGKLWQSSLPAKRFDWHVSYVNSSIKNIGPRRRKMWIPKREKFHQYISGWFAEDGIYECEMRFSSVRMPEAICVHNLSDKTTRICQRLKDQRGNYAELYQCAEEKSKEKKRQKDEERILMQPRCDELNFGSTE